MSLISGRKQFCQNVAAEAPAIPEREFLEKALKAIKARRGLIHGTLRDGAKVCAVGAVVRMFGEIVVTRSHVANALQEFNDSMPKATPALRRVRVIAWIEKKLARMTP